MGSRSPSLYSSLLLASNQWNRVCSFACMLCVLCCARCVLTLCVLCCVLGCVCYVVLRSLLIFFPHRAAAAARLAAGRLRWQTSRMFSYFLHLLPFYYLQFHIHIIIPQMHTYSCCVHIIVHTCILSYTHAYTCMHTHARHHTHMLCSTLFFNDHSRSCVISAAQAWRSAGVCCCGHAADTAEPVGGVVGLVSVLFDTFNSIIHPNTHKQQTHTNKHTNIHPYTQTHKHSNTHTYTNTQTLATHTTTNKLTHTSGHSYTHPIFLLPSL